MGRGRVELAQLSRPVGPPTPARHRPESLSGACSKDELAFAAAGELDPVIGGHYEDERVSPSDECRLEPVRKIYWCSRSARR